MEKKLETVMELCREPMLAAEGGAAVYVNAAARAAFPGLEAGAAAVSLLPDHILFSKAERFTAAVGIGDKQYAVSGARCGKTRLFTLSPREGTEAGRGLLSDGLSAEMNSTLFTVGLAARRISALVKSNSLDEAEQPLSILQHSYFSLRRQLGNLETAQQLREGTLFFSPRRTELVSFCAGLTESVGMLTQPGRAALGFSSQLAELWACVDPVLVERLVLNLLVNSLEHTPAEGEVRLRLSRGGENAVLSVDDNGEGIPSAVLRNVFTRYEQRLDAEHLEHSAAGGLGLGVASGLATLHGGALVIESREGKGTSVRAMLPLEQPGGVMLRSGDRPEPARGMDIILTELSGLLGPECYTEKYLD